MSLVSIKYRPPPKQGSTSRCLPERGFSVLELLAVMALAAVIGGVAVFNLRTFNDPLTNGAAQMVSFLKQVRARAISSTLAYTIRPGSSSTVITETAITCSSTDITADDATTLELPSGSSLTDTNWQFCFDSRGMPDANIEIEIEDAEGGSRVVEVLLGGAVRIQ